MKVEMIMEKKEPQLEEIPSQLLPLTLILSKLDRELQQTLTFTTNLWVNCNKLSHSFIK